MNKQLNLYENLRNRVVNGVFAPGQKLKSETLCREYGCSATTLREVLFRLSTVGLAEFQEQRGFRIPECCTELQHDLTQFRILLESEGAVLSIRMGGIDWESRLAAAHHRLSHIESRVREGIQAPDLVNLWSQAELAFHTTLIDACGSETLKTTHNVIYHRFRQQVIGLDKKFVFIPENVEQHQAILDAALAKDEAQVRRHIHEHLRRNLARPYPAPVVAGD